MTPPRAAADSLLACRLFDLAPLTLPDASVTAHGFLSGLGALRFKAIKT